jgi:predicted nuclease of predicted toxin-antitoxin system
MKLLLDQNVSHRLVAPLSEIYPGTTQVGLLGLGDANDREIWDLAQQEGYVLVSHDADFEAFSVLAGGPPFGDLAALWQSAESRDPGKTALSKRLN